MVVIEYASADGVPEASLRRGQPFIRYNGRLFTDLQTLGGMMSADVDNRKIAEAEREKAAYAPVLERLQLEAQNFRAYGSVSRPSGPSPGKMRGGGTNR